MKNPNDLHATRDGSVKYQVVRKLRQNEESNIRRIVIREAPDRAELSMSREICACSISGLYNAVCCLQVVLGDMSPDGINIFEGFRRKEVFTDELCVP